MDSQVAAHNGDRAQTVDAITRCILPEYQQNEFCLMHKEFETRNILIKPKSQFRVNKLVVVALGGNAIKRSDQRGSAEEQWRNVRSVCHGIARMVARGYGVVVTHGNGPQVGNLLIQQEMGGDEVPPQPLDILGAMTQGQIGYMLQQTLCNLLEKEGPASGSARAVTLITQVLVNEGDPEFRENLSSKPIGPFYGEQEASRLRKERGYYLRQVSTAGSKTWRRVVASPDPIMVAEKDAVKTLVAAGFVVIACGGGGVPVIHDIGSGLKGVEAVIDKDLASERLAELISADVLLILTDVDKVALNLGKANQIDLDQMTVNEATNHLTQGQFGVGSMAPKIEACVRFLRSGGKRAIIASLEKSIDALEGRAGTAILP